MWRIIPLILLSGILSGCYDDGHRAAIVQIGPAEILMVVVVVALVTAVVCMTLFHTRLNPYIQDRDALLRSNRDVGLVAVNLQNLATYMGAAAIVQSDVAAARELDRRLGQIIMEIRRGNVGEN